VQDRDQRPTSGQGKQETEYQRKVAWEGKWVIIAQ